MKKPRKAKLITPFFMLLAGAITSIVMFSRGVDFLTMLVTLLIVLLIFYFIGDVIRYIYEAVQPRVISMDELYYFVDENGHVIERTADEEEQQSEESTEEEETKKDEAEESEAQEETFTEDSFEDDDEYSEEDLAEEM